MFVYASLFGESVMTVGEFDELYGVVHRKITFNYVQKSSRTHLQCLSLLILGKAKGFRVHALEESSCHVSGTTN